MYVCADFRRCVVWNTYVCMCMYRKATSRHSHVDTGFGSIQFAFTLGVEVCARAIGSLTIKAIKSTRRQLHSDVCMAAYTTILYIFSRTITYLTYTCLTRRWNRAAHRDFYSDDFCCDSELRLRRLIGILLIYCLFFFGKSKLRSARRKESVRLSRVTDGTSRMRELGTMTVDISSRGRYFIYTILVRASECGKFCGYAFSSRKLKERERGLSRTQEFIRE